MKDEEWREYFQLFGEEELKTLDYYLNNEMCHLKRIVNPMIGGYTKGNFEYGDIYDDAIKVLCESIIGYDGNSAKFETFFTGNVARSIRDWHRDNHCRAKRSPIMTDVNGKIIMIPDENDPTGKKKKPKYMKVISFDATYDDENNNLKEKIPDKIADDFEWSPEMVKYLKGLSKLQLAIIHMLAEGYIENEIINTLGIDKNTYKDNMKAITDNKRTKYIRRLFRRYEG